MIALRAKKETLASDVLATKTKVEDLTKGIADTRSGVTDVKSFIDGMRSSRDTKVRRNIFLISRVGVGHFLHLRIKSILFKFNLAV